MAEAPDDVTLRAEEPLPYVVEVQGEVAARFARWSHAMKLVEYLRTPRGRMTLDPMPPLGGEVE